jgi:ergothioneine biosynthesis protein EgtB
LDAGLNIQEFDLKDKFNTVRKRTEFICKPLQTEDYVVQPVNDVSPPKWHLGHSTWFFETFLLIPFLKNYQVFDSAYSYIFNSYYETIGARVIRTDRGNLTRPTVQDIYDYRRHVDAAMNELLDQQLPSAAFPVLNLGLNHEEQHQELLLTDIKYILGHNPLFPIYSSDFSEKLAMPEVVKFISCNEGVYEIGYNGDNFCFDNELGRHKVYVHSFTIADRLVNNKEYLEFINDGGYNNFYWWHAEAWDWVKTNKIEAPLYWIKQEANWFVYCLNGLQELDLLSPVSHVSYYEAAAFAAWKGMRLPSEFEWEAAALTFSWGKRWEWTESAYLPYSGFKKVSGAIGEYNGKFMINQMVLRGASIATAPAHSRISYRNFFHPWLRWQFTGIRLAK